MLKELKERESVLRDFFGISSDVQLINGAAAVQEYSPALVKHLTRFHLEWHVIPTAEALPFDEKYAARMYGMCTRDFNRPTYHGKSVCQELAIGHRQHQGRLVAVETTPKPRYHQNNRQFYGTPYGHDPSADPFAEYLGRAGFTNGNRYSHDYLPLREFGNLVNNEWRSRGLMPEGYRLTICPPVIFNLIGLVFHPEWSETESLEIGYYRDDHGNATCYAVGSNSPKDYSYVQRIETDSDWTYLGFRIALVPDPEA